MGSTITVIANYTDDGMTAESVSSAATAVVVAVTNVNNPVTGTVTIDNLTPAEGDTLMVSDDLVDIDGLGTFVYQWKSGGANVGMNATTYTTTQADVGNAITVTISFNDVDGFPETKTSAPTATVTNVDDVGIVSITGTPTQGQALMANISDADGITAGSISYEWKRGTTIVANTQSYDLVQTDVGNTLTVTVSYTDAQSNEQKNITSSTPTIGNVNDPGQVEIEDTPPEEDRPIKALVTDPDGVASVSNYQWKRGIINIGTNSDTYTVVQADAGELITVTVTYKDISGNEDTISSAAVTGINVNDVGVATISGTPTQGEKLTASITDADGTPSNITYQWKRGVTNVGTNSNTYDLVQGDVGKTITVTIDYNDGLEPRESATSSATAPIANVNDTGTATISGLRTQGQTLTAKISDADVVTPTSPTYIWQRGNVNISGATAKTYLLTQDDVNKTIKVTVSYTDGFNAGTENATSSPTGLIENVNDTGVATITGTATKGLTLTAIVTDPDGVATISSYQWKRGNAAIGGATSPTYDLVQADVGNTMTVTVGYKVGSDPQESATSDPTVSVAGVNNTGVATIAGTPTEGETLTANITDADGFAGSIFSYQWKREGLDITGAITKNYALVQDDVGNIITVIVSYDDGLGNEESVTSSATTSVVNVNNVGAVIIEGLVNNTAMDSATLTASVTDADGTTTNTLNYQWKRDGSDIAGANSISYVLQSPEDIGKAISVTVDYTDDLGGVESATSPPTNPTLDMTAPDITLPHLVDPTLTDPIIVDAEGLFTPVNIGAATANDNNDDGALTPVSNAPNRFSPGTTEVEWKVTDAAGNEAIATQTVIVRPLVDFSVDQLVAEDTTVSFRIILNGKVNDPVEIDYFVSGDLLGSAHTLVDGMATINAGEDSTEVSFTVSDSGAGTGDIENIEIGMFTPTDAALGTKTTLNIGITEENIAPVVSLSAVQAGKTTRTVIISGKGDVSVTSSVIDPNTGDSLNHDWSATDNTLFDTDGNVADDTFDFDPSNLTPGLYTLRLNVGDGSTTTEAEITLNILSDALASTLEDSDNDGIPNSLENPDPNGSNAANILPSQRSLYTSRLLETEAGLKFSLGAVAFEAGKGQANVTLADTSNAGHPNDIGFAYPSGLFDFDIEGLGAAGQSIDIVLPQQLAIPANATYRKLVANNWQEFVIDDNNAIASALGASGFAHHRVTLNIRPGLPKVISVYN